MIPCAARFCARSWRDLLGGTGQKPCVKDASDRLMAASPQNPILIIKAPALIFMPSSTIPVQAEPQNPALTPCYRGLNNYQYYFGGSFKLFVV